MEKKILLFLLLPLLIGCSQTETESPSYMNGKECPCIGHGQEKQEQVVMNNETSKYVRTYMVYI